MALGKVANYERIRKENSKTGRLSDEGITVRKKENSVRGVCRLRMEPKRKEPKCRVKGEGKIVRKKVNGVGKGSDGGQICKKRTSNRRLWGEGIRVIGKMNGLVGVHRLRTDPQRKEQK